MKHNPLPGCYLLLILSLLAAAAVTMTTGFMENQAGWECLICWVCVPRRNIWHVWGKCEAIWHLLCSTEHRQDSFLPTAVWSAEMRYCCNNEILILHRTVSLVYLCSSLKPYMILFSSTTAVNIYSLLGLLTLGAHAQRVLVCVSACVHVFCHCAQQGGQESIPTGSALHWLDLKNGDFRKSTAFKSYGVKTKWTSQYANEVRQLIYLMDNWWTERCLRGWLQQQTVSKRRENRQRPSVPDRCGYGICATSDTPIPYVYICTQITW